MAVEPYVSGENLTTIKMKFDVEMSKYEITEKTTEIVPYSESENQRMLEKFLYAKAAKGLSKRTIAYYKQTVTYAFHEINKSYRDITAEDIRLYIAKRIQRDGCTKATANNERRNLSAFFGWLQKEEILLKNPMNKVEKIKETKEQKKAFTVLETEQLRNACKNNRERAIVETMFSTWCRVSELVGIKLSDIDGGKCSVHGKGDKIREVYFNARAKVAIDDYLKERHDDNPYLFPGSCTDFMKRGGKKKGAMWYTNPKLVSPDKPCNIGSIESVCRNLGRRAGVTDVHPHRFRRTGATMALRAGMPIIQVSKLMGHESLETTQIYLDITEDELEAAHEKYVL